MIPVKSNFVTMEFIGVNYGSTSVGILISMDIWKTMTSLKNLSQLQGEFMTDASLNLPCQLTGQILPAGVTDSVI